MSFWYNQFSIKILLVSLFFMLKKIFLFTFIIFALTSCFGWDNESWTVSGLSTYNYELFSIDVPSSWEVIKDKEKILPKPKSWDISMAVTSKKLTDGFAHNLLILSSNLKNATSSRDFSILNNIWAQKDYLNYRKIDSKEFTFSSWEKSMIYIFEAKYNIDTPKLKFLQTAYVCDDTKAHFFTVALSSQVRDTSKYEAFLKTFTCK